jgi:hypothetical protein
MSEFDELLDRAFGKKKPTQVEVSLERLHPPKAPPPPIEIDDITYEDIDYYALAKSSEFRRFVYMVRTGKTFRGSNDELDKQLSKTQTNINTVQEITRNVRGSKADFKAVMEEFKEVLQRRRDEID